MELDDVSAMIFHIVLLAMFLSVKQCVSFCHQVFSVFSGTILDRVAAQKNGTAARTFECSNDLNHKRTIYAPTIVLVRQSKSMQSIQFSNSVF